MMLPDVAILAFRIATPSRGAYPDRSQIRARSWLAIGGLLVCALTILGFAVDSAAQASTEPRNLLIQVRDTAPGARANFLHERDRSYTVSTGSGADRDERVEPGANNATVLSTSNSVRLLRVREGEPVRVDLPSLQTLQFHVPVGKAGASSHTAAAPGAGGPKAPGGASAPVASAVVYFESVSAFAARFALLGKNVRVELVPLQTGGVAAPSVASAAGASASAVTLLGRVGEWIALGDVDLVSTGKSLTVTAEAPSQPTVWVRVVPDPAARP